MWVFVLTLLFTPGGDFGGPVELTVRAKTEQGCLMVRKAAVKQLAENLVQHRMTPCTQEAPHDRVPAR